MKIIFVAKSTSTSGKVKYFNDFLQASIHIQSNDNNTAQAKIESCPVLLDGRSCYVLENISDRCGSDLRRICSNEVHAAKRVYSPPYEDGNVFHTLKGYELIHSESFECFRTDVIQGRLLVCKDENGSIYEVGKLIKIEKPLQEYAEIERTISRAIDSDSFRKYQAQTFFSQRQKEEYLSAGQELEGKKAKFDR